MALNKIRKGSNMYQWVDMTWNPIRGKCPHGCVYCFMKDRDVGRLRLDGRTLEDNLGSGRTIFVGSSTDMFAGRVWDSWILMVLAKCNLYQNNYIFQSKNPGRFLDTACGDEIAEKFPEGTILGTTLESNRDHGQGLYAPVPWARAWALTKPGLGRFKKMVSIEPIMAFDYKIFLGWIRQIKPAFVSIGADSKGHNLPEPQPDELADFLIALREITEVKIKKNLHRLLPLGKMAGKDGRKK